MSVRPTLYPYEVAKHAHVCMRTVERWIKAGKLRVIPGQRNRQIPTAELVNLLETEDSKLAARRATLADQLPPLRRLAGLD